MRDHSELDAVKIEVLNLLIVYYTYRRTMYTYSPNAGTRFDMHSWFTYLRVMEHDLTMRLCRLDEKGSGIHSFRESLKSVRNQITQADLKVIDQKLTEYRNLINPLKVNRRNYYLAHLHAGAKEPIDPQGGFAESIAAAVEFADLLTGAPVTYTLSVGSQEPKVDLRELLSHSFKEIVR
jgi:hypothetical protein